QHHSCNGRYQYPLLCAAGPRRGEYPARRRLHPRRPARRQLRLSRPGLSYLPQLPAADDGSGFPQSRLGHPQCGGPQLHRARRQAADAGVGHHGRRRRELHYFRGMVDGSLSRPLAAARGLYIQPSRRWPARYRRSAAEDIDMLTISDLNVSFRTRRGDVNAVNGISFQLAKGERLGIVGESGSGKSVTSYALMRILDAGGRIVAGEAVYSGIDLRRAGEAAMKDIRGREISMIFQNPRAALNPIRKIGHQIEDVLRQHSQAVASNAKEKAIAALEAVRINDAAGRYE